MRIAPSRWKGWLLSWHPLSVCHHSWSTVFIIILSLLIMGLEYGSSTFDCLIMATFKRQLAWPPPYWIGLGVLLSAQRNWCRVGFTSEFLQSFYRRASFPFQVFLNQKNLPHHCEFGGFVTYPSVQRHFAIPSLGADFEKLVC